MVPRNSGGTALSLQYVRSMVTTTKCSFAVRGLIGGFISRQGSMQHVSWAFMIHALLARSREERRRTDASVVASAACSQYHGGP